MSKSKSSATQEQIMPAGKPNASFVTTSDKSGDDSLSGRLTDMNAEKSTVTESFGSKKSDSFDGTSEIMPQGKPDSTFINTSALK